MTKAKKVRPADHRQRSFLELFDPSASLIETPEPAPAGRGDAWLRDRLVQAIRASGLDRETVAELLSERLGRPVTKAVIDAWCGASRPHQLPAAVIPDLCQVLGNTILLGGVAEASGCRLIEGQELQLARLGQITLFLRLGHAEQERIIAALPLFRERAHG